MDQIYSNTLCPERKRGKHLNFKDRGIIKALHAEGYSRRQIAKKMNCAPNTIKNELKRGTLPKTPGRGRPPVYNPVLGQKQYEENRQRCHRPAKFESCKWFIDFIVEQMKTLRLSVDQAVGRVKKVFKLSREKTICCKTFYNYIWKGLLEIKPIDLPEALKRHSKKSIRLRKSKRPKGKSIEERPAFINECKDFGHWEIDTVIGQRSGKGAVILTLLEKRTRMYLAFKIPGKTSKAVLEELINLQHFFGERFNRVFKSITADNGNEFERLTEIEEFGTKVYFAHPYASWERPQNERHNRILRKFVPKGVSIDSYSEDEILNFADIINDMPRRILNFYTPAELFDAYLDKIYAI